MKTNYELPVIKWFFLLENFVLGVIIILIFHYFYQVNVIAMIICAIIVLAISFIMLHFTFNEIIRRETKIKNTMKELFSSYQYIGNVNRQIDILINLNKTISQADFTVEEIASFVVNTCGRLSEAEFCTVFYYDKNKERYRKSRVYYYIDKNKLNYFVSHLKCEICTDYMSSNEGVLEVDKDSDVKCKHFPHSFWEHYKMICVPFVFKGQKRGFMMIIHKREVKVSHINFKIISSLATQLGSAMN